MKAPAFQFYVRDWLCSRSVLAMTGEQVKAYVYLLCESWLQEPRASLPDDDSELASMARISIEKWREIKDRILKCFVLENNGRYYNEKLSDVSKISEIRSLNRKNKTKTKVKQKRGKRTTSNAVAVAVADAVAVKDKEKGGLSRRETEEATWRTNYSIYQEESLSAYNEIVNDQKFITEQQKYYPDVDLVLSLDKAYNNYWKTEAGWKKKKASKAKEIDWKATYRNALAFQSNRVYKKKQNKFGRQEADPEILLKNAKEFLDAHVND